MARVRIIGAGRAGSSMAKALRAVGHVVEGPVGRGHDHGDAGADVDAVIIATPDDAIAGVAATIRPNPEVVVLHLSGSLGLEVLSPHARRGALHPLIPLPTAELGAARLASGITYAVAGDELASQLAASLGGRVVNVPDAERARYHAAACIAANHVVAILGQVERVASSAGLPLDAFIDLARAAVEDAARLGPASALTGPAARGDWATLDRHLEAIDPAERPGYRAGVGLALELSTSAVTAEPVEDPVDDVPEVRTPAVSSVVG